MKPDKLYIKIYLSFIMVLIVSEILVFFLFNYSGRKFIGYQMEHNTIVKVGMLKDLIDEKARWIKMIDPIQSQEIKAIVGKMGKIYDAEVWISDERGKPLVKSFTGDVPMNVSVLDFKEAQVFGEVKLYYNANKDHKVFALDPLKADSLKGLNLNVIFNEGFQPQQKTDFIMGLVIIGAVVAFLLIPLSRIITVRIKELRESALRIADGELSRRVIIRSKDEIGELGIAFNQMAERLERMITGGKELTANVSHELRTPLTRIRIAEELLRGQLEKGDSRGFQRHMDSIREDIDELDKLIGRILDLSKLDIHESAMKSERFNLSDLLSELLERFEPLTTHKRLNITTELMQVCMITGDWQSLYTAFLNILDNAVKYTSEAGGIEIKMKEQDRILVVTIINTFEKLSETDLTRIFEPFYRSKTSIAPGSGLGLSIAAKIIKKHGGDISAFNSPGGFEIRVDLPMEGLKQLDH